VNFQVESDNLRSQAKVWHRNRDHVDKVKQNLADTIGQGSAFGKMAGSAGVSAMYNAWTHAIDKCLADAAYSFSYLDVALRSTADGYDTSDATSAMSMAELDKRLNEREYSHD
jgi:hypothetical protein